MPWNWVDLAILAIIGLSMLTGLVRGFVKELIALLIWVLAFWLAYHYTASTEVVLQTYIKDPSARKIAGFVGILLATLITGAIVNAILSFILKRSGLSGTDRLLGAGFGFVRGVFVVSLVIVVLNMTSIPHEDYSRDSILYPRFDPLIKWLNARMPNVIKQVQWIEQQGQDKVSSKLG
ncbi:MAG: colicin V synthesis protein [Legionellales bacterium RIFCSPHIGHO2_12_FULL_42_9]|nr:MAG: colicin V synthesis protein [Legionellales bacterium RIFCSPHIGHO2_12_FULL_42_9]